MQTRYEFVLPRGYVDERGDVHKDGVMRLATARDELEPLRDPTVAGADDPRLTVLVLARVVEKLGTLPMVTAHEIEGLFTADLAFLQDFYSVINFGDQEEYEALLATQQRSHPSSAPAQAASEPAERPDPDASVAAPTPTPARRAAIEEIPARDR
jgi:hypothetical protein